MKLIELSRQAQFIKDLIRKDSVLNADIEMQSHWAKYICVLISGFLENAIHLIYSEYVKKVSNEKVSQFSIRQIKKIQNPKANKVVEIAKSFDSDWGNKLEKYLDDDGRKEAIDTIMNNRHLIAHGKPSNITLAPLNEYFKKTIKACEFIENQCGI
jgi:hypothetical protein